MNNYHLRLAMPLATYLFLAGFVNPSFGKEVAFKHDYLGFSINVPDAWVVEYSPGQSKYAPAIVATTPRGGAADKFLENCNVVIGKHSTNVDTAALRSIYESGKRLAQNATRDFAEYKKEEFRIDGLPVIWVINAFTGPGMPTRTKFLTYLIGHDQIVFIVACTAVPATFDDYEKIFHNISKSFRIQQR